MSALLEIRGLSKEYPLRRGVFPGFPGLPGSRGGVPRVPRVLRAVDRVDLDVLRGECLALVGESGSGKTTLGRCAIRLIEPSAGSVRFDGEDLLALTGRELRRRRRRFQMVFQDPYGSLDPRFTVERTVAEPLEAAGALPRRERRATVERLLARVGLAPAVAGRHPHELSGGQRQRVAIARALATSPDLLVADEPLSALDVSVQAQILNLLADLREAMGLTLLLVAHDLSVVERVADRVAVLYLGRLVELAATPELFAAPLHPYTASLLAAVPRVASAGRGRLRGTGPRQPPAGAPAALTAWPAGSTALPAEEPAAIYGSASSAGAAALAAMPGGCPFYPRCPVARPRCAAEEPPLVEVSAGRLAACFYPGEAPPPPSGPGMEQLGGRTVH